MIIANIVLGSVALPAVLLRCYSRWRVAKRLWWDDWTIIMAAVSRYLMCLSVPFGPC
jgi:nicotinamide riboside transporter PnuC